MQHRTRMLQLRLGEKQRENKIEVAKLGILRFAFNFDFKNHNSFLKSRKGPYYGKHSRIKRQGNRNGRENNEYKR